LNILLVDVNTKTRLYCFG